jgi:hypothetical protein
VGLLLDEWGVGSHGPDEEKKYGRLFQQITIRSPWPRRWGST